MDKYQVVNLIPGESQFAYSGLVAIERDGKQIAYAYPVDAATLVTELNR
ncbi:hypothetical protein [Mycobacteroides abscessus]|nr:hypothetical protein [Mycobacteroides abscessus]SIC87128.1 Uncharacterised protein [Mycobacteroides abscessus subsp. bolletii]SKT75522.1 Uncharacterised protein [Mycobacteroides abscessus subsp. bolletii]SLD35400.1 Uncharacterised protein [Mycobacteroides abscessus subsp. bolletii]SLF79452.1 Uncharacterised protein [Mycobacteroides abscessus subsp. bolletii]